MKINLNVTPSDKYGSRNVLRRKLFQNHKKKFKIKKTFQNRKKVKIVKKISKSRKRFQNGKNFFLKLEKLFFKIGKTFSKSGNFIDITIFFFQTEKNIDILHHCDTIFSIRSAA